jgi:FtsZ-interacting cell division protein ZipA
MKYVRGERRAENKQSSRKKNKTNNKTRMNKRKDKETAFIILFISASENKKRVISIGENGHANY